MRVVIETKDNLSHRDLGVIADQVGFAIRMELKFYSLSVDGYEVGTFRKDESCESTSVPTVEES